MEINTFYETALIIAQAITGVSIYDGNYKYLVIIAAGVGVSLAIEILQLPFFTRVTDIDDLILNSAGYLLGYGIYLLVKRLFRGNR